MDENVLKIVFRTKESLDLDKYFIATYFLRGTISLKLAAFQTALGQSCSNPNHRSIWETDELFENHCCKIIVSDEQTEKDLEQMKEGLVELAFPIININIKTDGISHLLCMVLGGQTDISQITKCQLLDLKFPPDILKHFQGPKFNIDDIRKYTNVYGRPLLGSILKPKTGINPDVLLEMVKQMVYGGVSFIKEDEILSDPSFCTIEERVPKVMSFLEEYFQETGRRVIYAVCINADAHHVLERVKLVHALGGNAIHVNFHAGIGIYKAIRELDLPLFVHCQTSGLRLLTDPQHRFSIDFKVMCYLIGLSGVSFFHAGMLFGYSGHSTTDVLEYVKILRECGTLPSMSCGLDKDNVNKVTEVIGPDYLANSGAGIVSYPDGITEGAKAINAAIESYKSKSK